MKKSFITIAIFTILTTASVTDAFELDSAWFTLEGQGANCAGVQFSQGSDQPLLITNKPLNCDRLTIGYRFTADKGWDGDGLMIGYAINLSTASPEISASNVSHVASGYDYTYVGSVGSGAGLLINQGRAATMTLNGTTGIDNLVMTFDLNFTNKSSGTQLITGDFGTGKQVYGGTYAGYLWYGRVAGGPISYGSGNYSGGPHDTVPGWGNQAVISITNVPEPASLALLGCGAFALIRRRR